MQYLLTSQPGTYAIQIQILADGAACVAGPSTGAFAVEGGRVMAVCGGVALGNHSDVLSIV